MPRASERASLGGAELEELHRAEGGVGREGSEEDRNRHNGDNEPGPAPKSVPSQR
jgi:hypothetical protein